MELLTRKEAAQYLRLSLRKLDEIAATGQVRRVKIGPGQRSRVLFRRPDLDEFIDCNTSGPQEGVDEWAVNRVKRRDR